MVKTFFRRWWTLRKLHQCIYGERDFIRPTNGGRMTHKQRVESGVLLDDFVLWGVQTGRNVDGSQVYHDVADCSSPDVGYINNVGTPAGNHWLTIGMRGHEAYVWYFPVVAFFRLEYVRHFTLRFITWAIPLGGLYLTSLFTKISINISSS